jgi:hypothetical protein
LPRTEPQFSVTELSLPPPISWQLETIMCGSLWNVAWLLVIGQSSYRISHHYRTIIIPDQSTFSDNHHTGSVIIIGWSSYRISNHYRAIFIIGQSSCRISHHYQTIIIPDQSSSVFCIWDTLCWLFTRPPATPIKFHLGNEVRCKMFGY